MTVYQELEKHFNAAAKKHPEFKNDFVEELAIYKKALLDNDPICTKILEIATTPVPGHSDLYIGDQSCRRPEVVEASRIARRIYLQHKNQP